LKKDPRLKLKESINGIRKELSAKSEIKRYEIKVQDMKRMGLLRKYNMEKKENWDEVIEELKQKVSAEMQLSRYRKGQSQ
jgi:hypothetical protein